MKKPSRKSARKQKSEPARQAAGVSCRFSSRESFSDFPAHAKAKPSRATRTRAARSKSSKSGAVPAFDLNTWQRWMLSVITHPDDVASGVQSREASQLIPGAAKSLENVILPSKNLGSLERIEVYWDAYFLRLRDCMIHDYAGVQQAVGEERFVELCREYLTIHPSTSYSLNPLGKRFPAFLQDEVKELPHREFLTELARLEWSIQEVFDERDSPPLRTDDLLGVKKNAWNRATLKTSHALRLHAFRYPVNRYLQAVYDEKPIAIPQRADSWVAVYRKSMRVWRARLDPVQYALLCALKEGKPLAEALELCADRSEEEPEKLIASIKDWFKEWAADGLFQAVEV